MMRSTMSISPSIFAVSFLGRMLRPTTVLVTTAEAVENTFFHFADLNVASNFVKCFSSVGVTDLSARTASKIVSPSSRKTRQISALNCRANCWRNSTMRDTMRSSRH